MKSAGNLKIVFTVSILLLILSLSISLINYTVSVRATQEELINRSLPLSVDNIYTEIQSHIIEPGLVSSMMAGDTFVKDWLQNDENDREKIARYLEAVKNRNGMFVTFLVSEKTQSYYTHNGFLEHLKKENPDNRWYFDFKQSPEDHEINLDYNENLDNSLMMFINYKIFDSDYHFIGATGIGHRISYIDDMLSRFREQFNFNVCFIDRDGKIVLAERREGQMTHLSDNPALYAHKEALLSHTSKILEYTRDGKAYLVNTKYIPELHLTLVVEAKMEDFTRDVNRTFWFNLTTSLLITLAVTLIILMTIRGYNRKLEYLATHDALTGLMNRRSFNERLEHAHLLSRRNDTPLSIVFFDLDNFKAVNDLLGHHVGDRVLKRLAELMIQDLRHTDLICRWGGEEFIIGLIETDVEHAEKIAEKLQGIFEKDAVLQNIATAPVTASFGVTQCRADEPLESVIVRVDRAMYEAKEGGKNRVNRL